MTYTPAVSSQTPYGYTLDQPVAQPGWTVESDGFGLLQAQVKFKWNWSKKDEFLTAFVRGKKLSEIMQLSLPGAPGSYYADLALWKANMVVEKGEVLTITADFCGVDPHINEGKRTNPIVSATGGASSEPIEHHPNFLVTNCISGKWLADEPVLAGWPPAKGWDADVATNPNRALWTPKVVSNGAIQGQQFVGFLPNQEIAEYTAGKINIKAGIKNYYKPQITLRVLQYLTVEDDAMDMASYIGWVTDGSIVNLPEKFKKFAKSTSGWAGTPVYKSVFESKINTGFLITNTSIELYGNIWKVTADLMLSGIAGWDPDIYPEIAD
jgi:hypothetical protein